MRPAPTATKPAQNSTGTGHHNWPVWGSLPVTVVGGVGGVGGAVGWAAYLLAMKFWPSEAGCYLIAAFILTAYGETMARVMHTPATVYVVAGAIPMVPGAGLYRAMSAALAGDANAAVSGGAKTLLLAAAIAGGILACMMLWSIVERAVRRG